MKNALFIFPILFCLIACRNEPKKVSKSLDNKISQTSNLAADTVVPSTKKIVETLPQPDYDTIKWTDIHLVEPDIIIDMKYATTENFVEEVMYECGRCLLRPDVAKGVQKAQQVLQKKKEGYTLKMLDCYRPRPVQQKLWDKVPNAMYVTPPSKGSMHNRGAAVDLTIVDDKGNELDMGTPFDFFGKRAHQDFYDLPEEVLDNRKLLKSTMIKAGFKPIRTEWWHYYYADGAPRKFEISDYLWECK